MPKKPETLNKVRLQFDFSEEAAQTLGDIRKRIDAGTKAEVIRRALRVFDYVTHEDCEIVLRYKDGTERLLEVK